MASANQSMGGFLTLLRKRNFLKLWLAQIISMTMLNASNYALITFIGKSTKKESATDVGMVIIFFCLPAVLLGGITGIFVDRRNKQRVLFLSNCLRAIVTCGFVILFLFNTNQLAIICLLTFLISSIGQFFTPAEGASIPMLVDKEELMPALSLFQVTSLISTPLGFMLFAPLLMGLLPDFAFMGLEVSRTVLLYLIMAILYALCAILVARIPAVHFLEPAAQTKRSPGFFTELSGALRNVWQETSQTWNFVRRRALLFESVVQLSFAGVLLLLISQLASPLVTDLLGLDPRSNPNAIALIFAPAGLALAISSLFLPRITAHLGKPLTIFIGCLVLAFMIALLPLSSALMSREALHITVVMCVMFLAGIAINFINTPANTAMQEQTPGWIKGRVLAFQLVLYNGSAIPILLLVGILTPIFSLSIVLSMLAAAIAAFGLWGFYYERKSHQQRHRQEEEEQDQGESFHNEPATMPAEALNKN
jgi:MFS family permease